MTTTHLTLIRTGDQATPHADAHGFPGADRMRRDAAAMPPSIRGSVAETAGTCARQADELAALAEDAGRLVVAQARALARGDVVEAARLGWGLGGALRTLAGSLGELHTVLDEIAHHAGPGAS